MTTSKHIYRDGNIYQQMLFVFWPPILVFSCHVFLVRMVNIYSSFPWLDIPMHYLGGLAMAYSLLIAQKILQERNMIAGLNKGIRLILVFTTVTTIAVFWEFGEFLLDKHLGTNLQISLTNTMQDLLMGILGAGSLVSYHIFKQNQ